MKYLSSLLLFSALSINVHAKRLTIGPELGLNISTMNISAPVAKQTPKVSVRAGAIADLRLVKGLSLQPGIFYAVKGSRIESSSSLPNFINDVRASSVEIPLNIQYNNIVNIKKIGSVFAGLGPSVSYLMGGTWKTTIHQSNGTVDHVAGTDLKVGTGKTDDLKPVSIGMGVNAGLKLNMGLLVRVQYNRGISDNSSNGITSIRHNWFCVSAGWLF